MPDEPSYLDQRWSKYFEEIDLQIAQLAVMCDIKVLDPGVAERILHNDATVCGKDKPETFQKLRALLMMHYSSQEKAMVSLGADEALKLVRETVERLRQRVAGNAAGS
jgi:hypothetical protein